MGHQTEYRERKILDTFCIEPGCEYKGKHAVQGHCYHKLDDDTEKYINKMIARANEEIVWMKNHYGDKYLERLEALCHHEIINRWFTLDELISLRYDNAKLLHENAKLKGKINEQA